MSVEMVQINTSNTHLLRRVAADVFDHEIRQKHLKLYLAGAGNIMIVALKDGEVVGQIRGVVLLQPDCGPQLFVENLGVTPELKRSGIATELMKILVERGRAQGCEEFWLATETENEEAIGFYDSLSLLKTDIVMFANFVDN